MAQPLNYNDPDVVEGIKQGLVKPPKWLSKVDYNDPDVQQGIQEGLIPPPGLFSTGEPPQEKESFLKKASDTLGFTRFGKNVASGLYDASAGASDFLAGLYKRTRDVTKEAREDFGLKSIDPKFVMDYLSKTSKGQRQKAAKVKPKDQSLFDKLVSGGAEMTASLPKYALATAAGGPVLGFGGLAATESYGRGESPEDIALNAAQGALTGAMFKGVEPLKITQRAPILGLGMGTQQAVSGGDPVEGFASGAVLGALGRGRKSIKDLYKTPVREKVDLSFIDKKPVEKKVIRPGVEEYVPSEGPKAFTYKDPTFDSAKFMKKVSEHVYGKDKVELKEIGGSGPGMLERFTDELSFKVNNGISKFKTKVGGAGVLDFLTQRAGRPKELLQAGDVFRGRKALAKETAIGLADRINEKLTTDQMKNLSEVLRGAKTKETLPAELKDQYELIREFNDGIHEINYGVDGILASQLKKRFDLGEINEKKFNKELKKIKNVYHSRKGTYYADMYDIYETEGGKPIRVKSGKELDQTIYKGKKDISEEWKKEHIINDPGYITAKRLLQTQMNLEYHKFSEYVVGNKDLWSSTKKSGYQEIPDAPTYGVLAGKFIRKDAARDILGFVSENKTLDTLYQGLKIIDVVRRPIKAGKTILNPGVRVGNRVGNKVFAWVNGMPELSVPANIYVNFGNKQVKTKGAAWRDLAEQGIVGVDFIRFDVGKVGVGAEAKLPKKKGWIGRGYEKIAKSYGAVDDAYKIGAYKLLLERGWTKEDAIHKIRKSFQDYSRVSWMWDVYAKIPLIGKPFAKFTPELTRIITNGIRANPLWTVALFGGLYGLSNIGSKVSGETPEERKIRESDPRSSKIFGQIPTTMMTPWGEVDTRRWLGLNQLTQVSEKLTSGNLLAQWGLPDVLNPTDPNSDVLFSPGLQALQNKTWYGSQIFDPTYERGTKAVKKLGRHFADAYAPVPSTPYFWNKAKSAFTTPEGELNKGFLEPGKKDIYGKRRTPAQVTAENLAGLRFRKFGEEELEEIQQKEAFRLKSDIRTREESIARLKYRHDLSDEEKVKAVEDAVKYAEEDYSDEPIKKTLVSASIQDKAIRVQKRQEADDVFELIKDKPLMDQFQVWAKVFVKDQDVGRILKSTIMDKMLGKTPIEDVVSKMNPRVRAIYIYENITGLSGNARKDYITEQVKKGVLKGSALKELVKLLTQE